MALTSEDLARIANLARLELRPDEQTQMLSQLNHFFSVVEKMNTVNTAHVTPLTHPVATIETVALRLRPDTVSEFNDRTAQQRNAPAVESGLFLVPKVIE